MRRWPQFMRDRSDQDSTRARSGSRFSQCGCSSLAGHFPHLAIRRRRNRPPFASDGSRKSSIPVHCSSGEKLQLKTIRAVSASLADATAHAAPTRADDCSPASAASIAPAKASRARDGLSGLAADSRREDLDGRQCLRAVERRLAFDVVFRGATDRNHQSRRHTGGQLPHGLPETRRPSERRRGGVAADRTRSNRKTAEARIRTFNFSGMPLKSKGDIQPPARPASL